MSVKTARGRQPRRSAGARAAPAGAFALGELAPAGRSALGELAPAGRSALGELAPAGRSALGELAPAGRSALGELAPAGRFALAALATWRVAHLLAEEDGPFDAVLRLRARAGDGALGALMDCFYCLSVWVAAPLSATTGRRVRDLPVTWLALSGAACLLERATAPSSADDPAA